MFRVPVSEAFKRGESIVRYGCIRNFALAVSLMICLCLPALARDSAPELNELMSARESGLLTDWRVVGPFGLHPSFDFDRQWAPERDQIRRSGYGTRKVELFQFANGQVKLPANLVRSGVFYASSQVYVRSAGDWRLFLESGGTLAVFIDGEKVLTRDDRHALQPTNLRNNLTLSRGDHRILVKFLNGAAPFRLAIMAPTGGSGLTRTFRMSTHRTQATPPPRCTTGKAISQPSCRLRSSRRIAARLVTPSCHPAPLHFFGKAFA